jgi:hypothetical protein
VFDGASVVWNGGLDPVSDDQAELSPAGAPERGAARSAPEHEHAPPGN